VAEPQAKEGRQITQIKHPFKNKIKSIIEYDVPEIRRLDL
jgi:hypothetical protein